MAFSHTEAGMLCLSVPSLLHALHKALVGLPQLLRPLLGRGGIAGNLREIRRIPGGGVWHLAIRKPVCSACPSQAYFMLSTKRLWASLSSSAFSSGAVGLQCAHAPVSLEALNFCLSALRMGGKNSM